MSLEDLSKKLHKQAETARILIALNIETSRALVERAEDIRNQYQAKIDDLFPYWEKEIDPKLKKEMGDKIKDWSRKANLHEEAATAHRMTIANAGQNNKAL